MELKGAKELADQLKKFGPKVSRKAADKGVRKAALYARREFKAAAPRRSGQLRKAIKFKYSVKSGRAWIGLRERYYYKTLEYGRKGGSPMHPFFARAWRRIRRKVASTIVEETRTALYEEAGLEYIRSKARNNRRGRNG